VQYWTSRGFAVVDVNYGGSSGYGREYRERLHWQWGIVDVDDNINAAKYLVEEGKADPDRLIIRGGSAGGYTTLAALAFHPEVFGAGASYYGVSDVEALAKDTHKFESRYLDTMIGPYPAARDLYHERSPIHYNRPAVVRADPLPGTGRQGRATGPVGEDGRRGAGQGPARRLHRVRGRAARVPPRGNDHPLSRGGAVFLRRDIPLHAGGHASADYIENLR
jgi:hypothetical protein